MKRTIKIERIKNDIMLLESIGKDDMVKVLKKALISAQKPKRRVKRNKK